MSLKCIQLSLVLILFLFSASTFADENRAPSSRQKAIDFEDSLVEGLNKRPLDSFSQLSERDKRKKLHLYKKRSGFRMENQKTLEDLRFGQ